MSNKTPLPATPVLTDATTSSELSWKEQWDELVEMISNSTILFSTHSNPGAGAHANYMFGSPAVEQEAAFSCINRVLDFLINQQQIPRNSRDFRVLLMAILHFLQNLTLEKGEYFRNQVDAEIGGGTSFFVASPAFDAMRLKLSMEIRKKILLLNT
jgi:hypothetical protein